MTSVRCCYSVNFLLNNAKFIPKNTNILNQKSFQNSSSFDNASQIRYLNNFSRPDSERYLGFENFSPSVPQRCNNIPKLNEFLHSRNYTRNVQGCSNVPKYPESVRGFLNRPKFSQGVQGCLNAPWYASPLAISTPSLSVRHYSTTSIPSHYEALELERLATQEEIKAAYIALTKLHHPDFTGGDDARFKQIAEAYKVLMDTETRKVYDEKFPAQLNPSEFNMGRNFKDKLHPPKPRPKKVPRSQQVKIGPYEMQPWEANNYKELRHNFNYNREFKGQWREDKRGEMVDKYVDDVTKGTPNVFVMLGLTGILGYIAFSLAWQKRERLQAKFEELGSWAGEKASPIAAWGHRFARCVRKHAAPAEVKESAKEH